MAFTPTPSSTIVASPPTTSVFDASADAKGTRSSAPTITDEEAMAQQRATAEIANENTRLTNRGISVQLRNTQEAAAASFSQKSDWRVRLSLAPGADYLYRAKTPGILAPLVETDGIIFPYTPTVQVQYAAQYDPATLTHSNYKLFQYGSSSVDNIQVTCEFTAQDTYEANYLLAVVHFLRSATKMFYGKDSAPRAGTPPPLCYLTGFGQFQFDSHPLVINSFNYSLPNEVDYIRADSKATDTGRISGFAVGPAADRIAASGLKLGAAAKPPQFNYSSGTNTQATYVPTKMQISFSAHPIVTRNDISKNFSLGEYATGKLTQHSGNSGGIW